MTLIAINLKYALTVTFPYNILVKLKKKVTINARKISYIIIY